MDTTSDTFRKRVLQQLDNALLEDGLAHPLSLEDKVHREAFEEGFLEGHLTRLSEEWQAGKVTQWEFQEKAMVLHAMLDDVTNNPGRFTWLLRRHKPQGHTGLKGEA